ncbi:MAG TPA: hypothetical protein VF618_08240 [Thermoanaerobaculia bacterium]
MANTWTAADDGGVEHQIVVDVDAQTGKTFIRVDGRLVARPLAPEEESREFKVGNATYVLRRLDDGFDIDVVMTVDALPKTMSQRVAPPPVEKSPVPGIIVKALVTVLISGLLYWGYDSVMYMRVPWKAWNGPSVRVDFPGEPERRVEKETANGETFEMVMMSAEYRRHGYALAYWDLGGPVPLDKVDELQAAFVTEFVKGMNGTMVKSAPGRVGSRWGVHFIANVPKTDEDPAGSIRGQLALNGRRVYLQFAFVPKGASLSYDVGEFLRSLRFSDQIG